jgi:hypothetical protein
LADFAVLRQSLSGLTFNQDSHLRLHSSNPEEPWSKGSLFVVAIVLIIIIMQAKSKKAGQKPTTTKKQGGTAKVAKV